MHADLTVELLRSLAAIADTGSMSKASDQACITQSALSLQMKRLAALVQAPILQRHSRGMRLTPAGKTLLTYGRSIIALNDRAISIIKENSVIEPIRIGVVDAAESLLTATFPRLQQVSAMSKLLITVGKAGELLGLLSDGLLDLVVSMGDEDEPAAVVSREMAWIGNRQLCFEPVLPIVVLEKPCVYRAAAIAALEKSGRDYRIILETSDLFVLRAAIVSGIGITCRSSPFTMANMPPMDPLGVPLPKVAYCLHIASIPTPVVENAAKVLRTAMIDMTRTAPAIETL